MKTYPLTIDGKPAQTGRTSNVLNPADGTVVGIAPEGDVTLLDQAVQAARRALPAWSALPDADRAAALSKVAVAR